MAFITNPTISTNGLSLYLDSVNARTYSGSGNTAYDLSGSGGTCYLINSPTFSSAGYSSYFSFDGTNPYMDCAQYINRTAYTKIAIFQIATTTDPNVFIGGDSTYQHALWMAGGNKLSAGHNNRSGGSFTRVQSTTTLQTDKWYFGAVTFNNSTGYALYLNQNLEATSADTSMFAVGNATIHIAAHNDGSNLLHGKLSQVLVYNRVLSQSEILEVYYSFKYRYGY